MRWRDGSSSARKFRGCCTRAWKSDPGHAIWKRDFLGASGLFSVILKPVSKTALAALLDGLELFGMGYSWGGYESLVIPFDCRSYRSATTWAPEGPALRFSVGLEDIEDLKADLDQGFRRMRTEAMTSARLIEANRRPSRASIRSKKRRARASIEFIIGQDFQLQPLESGLNAGADQFLHQRGAHAFALAVAFDGESQFADLGPRRIGQQFAGGADHRRPPRRSPRFSGRKPPRRREARSEVLGVGKEAQAPVLVAEAQQMIGVTIGVARPKPGEIAAAAHLQNFSQVETPLIHLYSNYCILISDLSSSTFAPPTPACPRPRGTGRSAPGPRVKAMRRRAKIRATTSAEARPRQAPPKTSLG